MTKVGLENLFSDNTKMMQLIYAEIKNDFDKNGEIEDEKFEKIDEIVQNSYETDGEDIEDMGDLIMACNGIMDILFTSRENLIRYENILTPRKKAKKLAHKKFRSAYDFYYKEEIEKGKAEKIIKYEDEKPRDIFNVEECVYQYTSLVKYRWEPSTLKLKSKIHDFGL